MTLPVSGASAVGTSSVMITFSIHGEATSLRHMTPTRPKTSKGSECSFERCRRRSQWRLPPCDQHCPRSLDAVAMLVVAVLVVCALISLL